MTLEEILVLEDIAQKIALLKQRKTPLPDKDKLLADWDPYLHDVMDKVKRPDQIMIIEPEERDDEGNITKRAVTAPDPVNRIALPLEQDIVNIHTAFTVGTEPNLTCETEDKKEKELFKIVKTIDRKNKIKYHNKRVVRSWLSETEVAEYWYTVKDEGFWKLLLKKVKAVLQIREKPDRKLKCVLWSPFKGDKLYPLFDEANASDLVAMSREYQVRKDKQTVETYFMTVTLTHVMTWKQTNTGVWEVVEKQTFAHKFKKMPIVYAYREKPLCHNIKPIRERLETVLSNYGDCLDYNFAPKLVAEGSIINNRPKDARGGLVETEVGGKLYYLAWQQTPEAAKLEIDNLTEKSYSMTNTPRISFENLQGMGNAFSGVSFKYAFMGAHMAVAMHAETIGLYFQRRYNFLTSAIGSITPSYQETSESIDIDVEIVPYMIDSLSENVKIAIDATGGEKIASRRTGIIMAGLVEADKVDEEEALIAAEEEKKTEESAYPRGGEI